MVDDIKPSESGASGGSAIIKARARDKGGQGTGADSGKSKNVGGRPSKAATEQKAAVEILITPESVGETVGMIFDVPEIMTGWEGWALEEDEKKLLGTHGAIALKPFITFDTKWLAVGIFGISFLKVITTKSLAYRQVKKEQAKQAALLHSSEKKSESHD